MSRPVVRRLKALGVELSLDDVGTGYSSPSYLKRVPLDKPKIDNTAIVRAIIQLVRALNRRTIAKGLEEEGTEQFLCVHQRDEAQALNFGLLPYLARRSDTGVESPTELRG